MSSSPGPAPARGPVAGGRVGLSEYTAQRLAELRARRAEVDSTDSCVTTKPAPAPRPSPTTSRAPADSVVRPTPTPTPAPAVTLSTASDMAVNGVKTETNSYSSYSSHRTDATSFSITVSSPHHQHPYQQQQQQQHHHYVTGTSRSPSSIRHDSNVAVDMTTSHQQDDDDCLGFASLPEQVHRKAVKRGFDFTVMVVGLGKSTLLRCLFLNNDLYEGRSVPPAQERIEKTVEIEKNYMEIEEKGVKLRLTVVDTPGFNDAVDARHCWKPIEDYIDSQFGQFYRDETGLNRRNIKDNRVHCCLYFIPPYGHGLRQVDVELMKCLQDRVNLVPVIAKSDTLTLREVKVFKTRILEAIEEHKIRIYEFPECDSDEDDEFKQQDSELKAAVPFAVMASNTVVEINGRKVRGRLYPWGIVEVDNASHSDFNKLRQFIISSHMQDLKDVTRDVHYENYRARHMQQQLVHSQKERNRLKRESGTNFDAEQLLQQKEQEIEQMKQMLEMMNTQLANNKSAARSTVNNTR